MKTVARLSHDRVSHAADNDVHLVVSLSAPRLEPKSRRAPVCVIPVIDVSPSMMGEKIHYAKQSVLKLIENLQPGDYCGLVQFAGSAETLCSPVEVTQARKDELRAKVGGLSIGSATNIAGALLEGLLQASKTDLPAGTLVRVILFTDGLPNTGVAIRREDIVALLAKSLGGATVSAFGYGHDADQDLLSDIARVGKGNYAFVKNPDDALTAFAKELGGLLSTYAQNLCVEVEPHAGHRVVKVVSDVDVEEKDGSVTVKIPAILSEETRDLVMAVRLGKQDAPGPRMVNALAVRVSYDFVGDDGKIERRTCEAFAKVQFCKPGEHQADPTPEVDKIVGIAQMVEAQIEAEKQANAGNFAGAVNVMSLFAADAQTRGLAGVEKAARNVGTRMKSRQAYDMGKGYLVSNKAVGTRAVGTSGMDAEVQCLYQADLGMSVSSSAQDDMVQAFTGDAQAAGLPVPAVAGPVLIQPAAPSKPAAKPVGKSRSKRW